MRLLRPCTAQRSLPSGLTSFENMNSLAFSAARVYFSIPRTLPPIARAAIIRPFQAVRILSSLWGCTLFSLWSKSFFLHNSTNSLSSSGIVLFIRFGMLRPSKFPSSWCCNICRIFHRRFLPRLLLFQLETRCRIFLLRLRNLRLLRCRIHLPVMSCLLAHK